MAWLGGKSSEGATAPLSLVRKQGDGRSRRHPVAESKEAAMQDCLIRGGSHGIISFSEGRHGKAGGGSHGGLSGSGSDEVFRIAWLGEAALVLPVTGGES